MNTNQGLTLEEKYVFLLETAWCYVDWSTLDIREMPQEKAKKCELQIDQVILTGWGKRCLTMLLKKRPFAQWNQQADNYFSLEAEAGKPEKNVDVSTFAGVFRKAFKEPDLVSMYPVNKNPQAGELWLRAELPHHKVSRTIAMPVSETLEELHLMIQDAFDFGNDHLYCFCMNLRNPYSGKQYFDPRIPAGETDGYPADETTLVSLNLYEG